jgi:hypothetical protein
VTQVAELLTSQQLPGPRNLFSIGKLQVKALLPFGSLIKIKIPGKSIFTLIDPANRPHPLELF